MRLARCAARLADLPVKRVVPNLGALSAEVAGSMLIVEMSARS